MNSARFQEFLIDIRKLNSTQDETKDILNELLEYANVDEEKIEKEISENSKDNLIQDLQKKIDNENLSKEELNSNLQDILQNESEKDNAKISRIKSTNMCLNFIKKFNINIDKNSVKNAVKLRNMFKDEEQIDKKIKEYFKNEKRIVMIIDNYSAHVAYLVRLLAKILNIKLIFLPKYSPKLNPIEQVWRTIKIELYTKYIKSEQFLIDRFTRIYYEIVDNSSFTENWINKFIAKN
ncbi:MAG: transposase [Methanobrevibacter sp.]|jgi:transposase|nr:transposase [Candidatus Methanoflexus mossambicus]